MPTNMVSPTDTPWYQLFSTLQHVDDPYSLVGLLGLICMVLLHRLKLEPRSQLAILVILGIATTGSVALLLKQSLQTVERNSAIHLVNDDARRAAEIARGIRVELVDITSFKGAADPEDRESGQRHNVRFAPNIWREVFERAGINAADPTQVRAMTQEEWDEFRRGLRYDRRRRLLTIPFVRLRIRHDGRIVQDGWWLKGEEIQITEGGGTAHRLKIENIYNTSSDSGEPEAINVSLTQG